MSSNKAYSTEFITEEELLIPSHGEQVPEAYCKYDIPLLINMGNDPVPINPPAPNPTPDNPPAPNPTPDNPPAPNPTPDHPDDPDDPDSKEYPDAYVSCCVMGCSDCCEDVCEHAICCNCWYSNIKTHAAFDDDQIHVNPTNPNMKFHQSKEEVVALKIADELESKSQYQFAGWLNIMGLACEDCCEDILEHVVCCNCCETKVESGISINHVNVKALTKEQEKMVENVQRCKKCCRIFFGFTFFLMVGIMIVLSYYVLYKKHF